MPTSPPGVPVHVEVIQRCYSVVAATRRLSRGLYVLASVNKVVVVALVPYRRPKTKQERSVVPPVRITTAFSSRQPSSSFRRKWEVRLRVPRPRPPPPPPPLASICSNLDLLLWWAEGVSCRSRFSSRSLQAYWSGQYKDHPNCMFCIIDATMKVIYRNYVGYLAPVCLQIFARKPRSQGSRHLFYPMKTTDQSPADKVLGIDYSGL